MNLLPAIVIGGPPHSGKSVLAYSLSQALRQCKVQHYVLRAYPDGEGDWANQAKQELVRAIRIKGVGSPEWVQRICRDIDRRHLPLIVDPGGKPTAWQEAIFDYCTHSILLWPDAASREVWRSMFYRHSLTAIADLQSDLRGVNAIADASTILQGTLAGLERGQMASGPAFDALVERICGLFAYAPDDLRKRHIRQSPAELVLELERLGRTLDALDATEEWQPQCLPATLDYLPPAVPLGLYGRAPNWLYAALALFAYPESLCQFDVRLGWVSPPLLCVAQPAEEALLQATIHHQADHLRIEFALRESYLDYGEADGLCIPPIPPDTGVVLSGKLPQWMWTAIALAYRSAHWLGIYQPKLHDKAVIIKSDDARLAVGQLVRSPVCK